MAKLRYNLTPSNCPKIYSRLSQICQDCNVFVCPSLRLSNPAQVIQDAIDDFALTIRNREED